MYAQSARQLLTLASVLIQCGWTVVVPAPPGSVPPSFTLDQGPSSEFVCGANQGGSTCFSIPGSCCSIWGFCGSSSEHCGVGCQSGYGKCDYPDSSEVVTQPIVSSTATATSSAVIGLPSAVNLNSIEKLDETWYARECYTTPDCNLPTVPDTVDIEAEKYCESLFPNGATLFPNGTYHHDDGTIADYTYSIYEDPSSKLRYSFQLQSTGTCSIDDLSTSGWHMSQETCARLIKEAFHGCDNGGKGGKLTSGSGCFTVEFTPLCPDSRWNSDETCFSADDTHTCSAPATEQELADAILIYCGASSSPELRFLDASLGHMNFTQDRPGRRWINNTIVPSVWRFDTRVEASAECNAQVDIWVSREECETTWKDKMWNMCKAPWKSGGTFKEGCIRRTWLPLCKG